MEKVQDLVPCPRCAQYLKQPGSRKRSSTRCFLCVGSNYLGKPTSEVVEGKVSPAVALEYTMRGLDIKRDADRWAAADIWKRHRNQA